MMDMQGLIDALSKAGEAERGNYHLTLGGLITALKNKGDMLVEFDHGPYPGEEHSYRGYYSDLSFEPCEDKCTADQLLARCVAAMGNTYEGWKGGAFVMHERTPLWCANEGDTGSAIMGFNIVDGKLILATKNTD